MTRANGDANNGHDVDQKIYDLEAAFQGLPNEALVCVVLDMSGSMGTVWDTTIEVFNEYLAGLKAQTDPLFLSLIMFDQEYLPQYFNQPVALVPALTKQTYVPRGSTALLDAMGRCITETAGLRHRPERVLVVTITDGEENASQEYTHESLVKLVTRQQAEGWEFLYLSAAIDAFADSARIGIQEGRMLKFSHDPSSMKSMRSAMHRATELYSKSGSSDLRDLGYADDVADVPEDEES